MAKGRSKGSNIDACPNLWYKDPGYVEAGLYRVDRESVGANRRRRAKRLSPRLGRCAIGATNSGEARGGRNRTHKMRLSG